MRKIAEANLASRNNFISIHSTAENTKLPDHCIDCVTAAQSFHWFNRKLFKIECQRILKNKGPILLIWNCRQEEDELVQAVDSINREFCQDFSGSACGMRGEKNNGDYSDFFSGNYEIKSFYNPILFNKERFLGLHQSASYCPDKRSTNYIKYINSLSKFFDKHCQNGILKLENNTQCYIGYI